MSKVAIVTGGAGGIGAPICRALAQDGMNVVVADFAEPAGKTLTEEIVKAGGEAIFQKVDVGDKASVGKMVEKTLERFSRIDFLLNGAGVISRAPVREMAEEDWDRVLRINLKGTFLCSQAVARPMTERRSGRILCLASGRGVAGQPGAAHYAASKAGVIAFVKSLAVELAPDNVLVNAIAPGATDTAMSRSGSTEEEWKKREAVPPLMGGLTTKEEIVGLVRYLLSEPAKYITGQTFFLRTPK
jgi:NAD(P)-dependent dehydrogenase (short-subunit alcohol dehydrogenase family)